MRWDLFQISCAKSVSFLVLFAIIFCNDYARLTKMAACQFLCESTHTHTHTHTLHSGIVSRSIVGCTGHERIKALTYGGVAPEAVVVLKSPHAATRTITDHTLSVHGKIALCPLMRHSYRLHDQSTIYSYQIYTASVAYITRFHALCHAAMIASPRIISIR